MRNLAEKDQKDSFERYKIFNCYGLSTSSKLKIEERKTQSMIQDLMFNVNR